MNTKQLLGFGGSALLFIGVFLPFVSVPIVGSLNYFQNGRGDGVIVSVLAVASAILLLVQRYRLLWFTGGLSLAIIAFTFVNFQIRISQARGELSRDLADNPFKGLGELAIQSVQLQWGLPVLVIGALLVIAAAAVKTPGIPESRMQWPPLSASTKRILAVVALAVALAAGTGIRVAFETQRRADLERQAQSQTSASKGNLKNIAVALESYFVDHGNYPDTLSDLIPDYLRAVPNDPCRGRAYTYVPFGTPATDYRLSVTFPAESPCSTLLAGLSYTPGGGLQEAP